MVALLHSPTFAPCTCDDRLEVLAVAGFRAKTARIQAVRRQAKGPVSDRRKMSWIWFGLLASLSHPLRILPHLGRVELLADDGHIHLLSPELPCTSSGPAVLVLGAEATAELSWPGSGSVRLVGPCMLEWDSPVRLETEGGGPRCSVRFVELGRAEVEWRAGELEVELPRGWRIGASRGAFGIAADGRGTRVE